MSINGTMAGFLGGYLGIGFDLFGAFVDGSYHHSVIANTDGPAGLSEVLGVRGPSTNPTDNTGINYSTGTPYLGGTNSNLQGSITKQGSTWGAGVSSNEMPSNIGARISYAITQTTRPSPNLYYRKARIFINLIGSNYVLTVQLKMSNNATAPFYTVVRDLPVNAAAPSQLKIGFVGTTGASTANQEIRNLNINTPVSLSTTLSADRTIAQTGDLVNYTVNMANTSSFTNTQGAVNVATNTSLKVNLNGVDIDLSTIQLNGTPVSNSNYTFQNGLLKINGINLGYVGGGGGSTTGIVTFRGTVSNTNSSVVYQSQMDAPLGYINLYGGVSAFQTLIRPVLTQPLDAAVCSRSNQ